MAGRAAYHQYENEIIRLCGYGDELVAVGGDFFGADMADESHRAASIQMINGGVRRYVAVLDNCTGVLPGRSQETREAVLAQARQAQQERAAAAAQHGGIDAAHQLVLDAVGRVIAACVQ